MSNSVDDSKSAELEEKKRRRLERNRASARLCRRRKKEKKLALRQQLTMLEAENLQLRLKLQVGSKAAAKAELDQSTQIMEKLHEMMTNPSEGNGANESELLKKLSELKERFSDYGRDRRSAIDFHIAQLRRCLQPTQTTRTILFLMECAAKYPAQTLGNEAVNPMDPMSVIWGELQEEFAMTPDQKKLLVEYSAPGNTNEDPFALIRAAGENCDTILNRIVEIVSSKNESLDQEMSSMQSILSPRQIAKFLFWIDRNPMCMQMLEALWPHLTTSAAGTYGEATGSSGAGGSTTVNNGSGNWRRSVRSKRTRDLTSTSMDDGDYSEEDGESDSDESDD